MSDRIRTPYPSEAALCAQFIQWATRKGAWVAYPETAGWDIVLARKTDGVQIGIEAKLSLNAEVVNQCIDESNYWPNVDGPDFRAVLVPAGKTGKMTRICSALGITVIAGEGHGELNERGLLLYPGGYGRGQPFHPDLPGAFSHSAAYEHTDWFDLVPRARAKLPEYVPDVSAGVSGPVQLTDWKIRAIKIVVLLDRRGWVCKADFEALKISPSRWMTLGWVAHGEPRGRLVRSKHTPDFKAQHPRNFEEIAADFDKWAPKPPEGLL